MKKCAVFLFVLCLLCGCFLLPLTAATEGEREAGIGEESDTVRPLWQDVAGAVPPEVKELLPDGFFEEDMTDVATGVGKASALDTVLSVVGRLTGLAFREYLAVFAKICGVLVLSATVRQIAPREGKGVGRAFSLCATLLIVTLLLSVCRTDFADIGRYFKTVGEISLAMLPLMGTLYAMGGNVGAAVCNHGIMSAFLVVLEKICATMVVPVAGICLALALFDAAFSGVSLRSLATLIKRTFTWGLSFLMVLLCGVLGIQTTLAKGADTLALRTVRFAAGSFLPVVGGSVSETLRTVSGSVEYLRATVGIGGILVVLFAFLPMFLSVLLGRLCFLLGGAVAGMLSLSGEEKVLSEFASVWGYFLAVIAALFVMNVFSLTLLARCASAVG
jgi:stage III sporulation protein AE